VLVVLCGKTWVYCRGEALARLKLRLHQVVRIDQTIKKKELNKVENLTKSFQRAIDGNGRLHLLGLVSDGGVVSNVASRCKNNKTNTT
jgi:bisphosphoglycerate-independent phosphoglycerate mutase (AlkP superfamily)